MNIAQQLSLCVWTHDEHPYNIPNHCYQFKDFHSTYACHLSSRNNFGQWNLCLVSSSIGSMNTKSITNKMQFIEELNTIRIAYHSWCEVNLARTIRESSQDLAAKFSLWTNISNKVILIQRFVQFYKAPREFCSKKFHISINIFSL